VGTATVKAGWALLMPVIILGGIFTPTEASAVAVFYALLVGVVIRIVTQLAPFVLVVLACLLVITYVPALSLTLRDLVYAK
jgi:C4-dicarboxylate transporter DctM subunit